MGAENERSVAIIHGGGDAPGLNAVTFTFVMAAHQEGIKVYGVRNGFEGLLKTDGVQPLTPQDVAGIHSKGGSILGTANDGSNFASKVGSGQLRKLDPGIIKLVHSKVESLRLECLIVLGGDGTLTTALELSESGIPVIGVPKTIDNDLQATDRTFGFKTAVDNTTLSLERIRDTLISMGRVGFVETYGRHTGHIALLSGVAAQAQGILIPEIPYELPKIAARLKEIDIERSGALVVVAEGAVAKHGSESFLEISATSESRLGNTARRLADEIRAFDPGISKISVDVLGHQVRGGSPNPDDRILADRFGYRAVQAFLSGEFGRMISDKGGIVTTVPLGEAVNGIRRVDWRSDIVMLARAWGTFFGDD